ncbi:MAG: hypothetical protein WAQ28_03450 [Bacteroidia bacterium]
MAAKIADCPHLIEKAYNSVKGGFVLICAKIEFNAGISTCPPKIPAIKTIIVLMKEFGEWYDILYKF